MKRITNPAMNPFFLKRLTALGYHTMVTPLHFLCTSTESVSELWEINSITFFTPPPCTLGRFPLLLPKAKHIPFPAASGGGQHFL